MGKPGVRQATEGSGEQGKMEETGCEIICGAPTTLAVKGEMMIMIIMMMKQTLILLVFRCAIISMVHWALAVKLLI